MRNLSPGGVFFGGVLIILILICFLVADGGFTGMGINNAGEIQSIFEVRGDLLWDNGNSFYNLYKGILKKLDNTGKALWERNIEGMNLLWADPEGVLLSQKDELILWNPLGIEEYVIKGFSEDVKVLDQSDGGYLLTEGPGGGECVSLLRKGEILWHFNIKERRLLSETFVGKAGKIICGSITDTGDFAAVALLDEGAGGELHLMDSSGEILSCMRESAMLYLIKAFDDGVVAVAEDRVFKADYSGTILWEHPFESMLCRADIGPTGNIAAVLKQTSGSLYLSASPKLLMLSREGEPEWFYGLDRVPSHIKIGEEGVYMSDDSQILVISPKGLMSSRVPGKGFYAVTPGYEGCIVANQGGTNKLIRISGGKVK